MKTFADFQPLKPAEQELFECCQSGEIALIGEERPTDKTEENEIRAEFLRWLILTKEVDIDPNGIMFQGAWISDWLDLENIACSYILGFVKSVFEEPFILRRSIMKTVYLDESLFYQGILADGLLCNGNFHLRKTILKDEARFLGSTIHGDFDCHNARFEANEYREVVLNCDGIRVFGYVFLCCIEVYGMVNFVSAYINRDFDCQGASLIAKDNHLYSLACDKICIDGTVYLNNGFNSNGEVRFFGAKVKGDFSSILATFKTVLARNALNFEGINIGRSLSFKDCKVLGGFITLTNASVGSIIDDKQFWEQKTLQKAYLDGFKYGHIHGNTSASFRLQNMLTKMPKFTPQPYKQLAKVLRDIGHDRDADEVMIALRDKQLEESKESRVYKFLRKLYKCTSAYGYRPMRILKIMVSIWALFGFIYWYGANVAVFAPSNPLIFQKDYNCTIDKNGTKWLASPKDYNESNNWYIASPSEYTTFQPFWYSLDIILPVVDLKMENDWGIVIPSPEGNWSDMIPFTTTNHFIRFLTWVESLAGWGLSLMLVAILSGLAKNEKE